ncbi:MAG TPA: RecQ family ATP-dependent DNA helicase [Gemmatimonadaceae bacterium]|nr:RecQ family ATP-dependent DNA helicase [Gemmatimonadaceae bacterium]
MSSEQLQARALAVLKSVFGYDAFRGQQLDVVTHVAAGNSALVLMPTGGGKSLCYQIPALLRDGVTVVISPLIALMQDQVAALERRGVACALLNSTLPAAEQRRVEARVRAGEIKLLYVSPERLATERCKTLLANSRVALFAVDEAHCISEWGHDFRPEYLALGIVAERFPDVPRMALTATADMITRAEIVRQLALDGTRQFVASFDRRNIRYVIVTKRNVRKQLLSFIRKHHHGETGVVYCSSRAGVDETAAFLSSHGITTLPYHAGLTPQEREDNQAWFLAHAGTVIVATIAFGMGIDKPDVRFVAHVDIPKSVEGYYQETGRAGRDGLESEAWMAYSPSDAAPMHGQISRSTVSPQRKRVLAAKLDAMLAFAESSQCRRTRLLAYFGEHKPACGKCDVCRRLPWTYDATTVVQQILAALHTLGPAASADRLIAELDPKRAISEWQSILRQCVAFGVLARDHETGLLRRTSESVRVACGERRIVLRVWRGEGRSRKTSRRHVSARDGVPAAEGIHERIRDWRATTAERQRVPAHLILHDTTMLEVAYRRPQSRWALRRIVGPVVTRAHGTGLLQLLNDPGQTVAMP